MNGKKNSWEGIALIPFINEQRLLDAIATIDEERLPENARRRNSVGTSYIFQYDERDTSTYPSPLPGIFADLQPAATSYS